jgi:ribonuclease HI
MSAIIIFCDGASKGNPRPLLETHGFPTRAMLAAFLHGKTIVFPTPFMAQDCRR